MTSFQLSLISREIDGEIIHLRAKDGYINATSMCRTAGKLLSDYTRLKTTQEFFDELSRDMGMNRPGFPGEYFICELRLPDHRFRWKHNKLFLLLPEEYGPAFPAIVDCYTSPPT
ncbi:BfpM-like protein [Escherichia coli]|uniref:KilA-N domain-containing protein n=1 Tax=Escherichia coli TaxID=562 RepID=UPI000E05144D|nr:KilA-N domain-containing protein [Escherichia coli]STH99026.1 BfpM-like protein [Escherichia coli]